MSITLGRIERGFDLGRGAGVVDHQAVFFDRDGDLDRNRIVGKAVGIDVIDERIGPFRPAPDLLARHAFGVVHQLGHILLYLVRAVALEQPAETLGADLGGRVLRLQVAPDTLGNAHVDLDKLLERGVEPAARVELERRDANAFLVDFG